MTITSSITNAVVVMIIVVVIVGTLLGFSVSKSELLNPVTSEANREWMEEETRHSQQLHQLEEHILTQEMELELAQTRAEYAARLESLQKESELALTLRRTREKALTGAAVVAVAIVAVGVAVLLGLVGYRWTAPRQMAARPAADPNKDVWRSRAYRDARIEIARDNEVRSRTTLLTEPAASSQINLSDNGQRDGSGPRTVNTGGQNQQEIAVPTGLVG
jgi:uncharacterized protein YneF (UPF0154 family)